MRVVNVGILVRTERRSWCKVSHESIRTFVSDETVTGFMFFSPKHIPLLILTALNLFVSFYETFLAHINVLQSQVSRGTYFAPVKFVSVHFLPPQSDIVSHLL